MHTVASCASCGAPRDDLYCARCGQPFRPTRIKLRTELGRFVAAGFDVDRGLLHTFLRLWIRPARVVADYLRGSTVAYTHPGKYFLLAIALLQLVAYGTGAVGDFITGLTEESELLTESQVAAALDSVFVLLAAPSVLLMALLQKRAFRHARLYFGEHLVFGLFIGAQQSLVWSAALAAAHLVRGENPDLFSLLAFLLSGVYYLWSAHRFFGGRLAANAARSLFVLALTPVLYLLLMAVVAGAAGVAVGAGAASGP